MYQVYYDCDDIDDDNQSYYYQNKYRAVSPNVDDAEDDEHYNRHHKHRRVSLSNTLYVDGVINGDRDDDDDDDDCGADGDNAGDEEDDYVEFVGIKRKKPIYFRKRKPTPTTSSSSSSSSSSSASLWSSTSTSCVNSTECFYDYILKLDMAVVLNSHMIDVIPLSKTPAYYLNRQSYYHNHYNVIMMECIASIKQEMNSDGNGDCDGTFTVTITDIEESNNPLLLVQCDKIFSYRSSIKVNDCEKIGYVFKVDVGRNRSFLASYDPTYYNSNTSSSSRGTSIGTNGDVKSSTRMFPLWISERYIDLINVNQIITVTVLSNVLMYQRMHEVCYQQPYPPFFNYILGSVPSSHIKFTDDGDVNADPLLNIDGINTIITTDITQELYVSVCRLMSVKALGCIASLNSSQMKALLECLSNISIDTAAVNGCIRGPATSVVHTTRNKSSVTIVQGPPGTGKTYYLASLLHCLLRCNKKVVVCCPSNKAVCVAMTTYLNTCDVSDIKDILLIGVEDKLDLDEVPVNATLKELIVNYCNPTNKVHRYAYFYKKRLIQIIDTFMTDISLLPSATQIVLASYLSLLTLLHNRIKKDIPGIYRQTGYSLKMYFGTIRYEMSRGLLKSHNIDCDYESCDGCGDSDDDDDDVRLENDSKDRKFSIVSDFKTIKNKLTLILDDVYIAELVRTSRVIFCTLSTSGKSVVRRNISCIDYLIVDEAAQALEVEVCIPFLLSPLNLVLVGDPCQLPATVFSRKVQRYQLDESIMERLINKCKYPYIMLDLQYRMHSEIVSWSNKMFYDGQISTSSHINTRSMHDLIPSMAYNRRRNNSTYLHNIPFLFIDINDSIECHRVSSTTGSCSNQYEAVMIQRLLTYYQNVCNIDVCKNVLVITFYTAQVLLIKKQLSKDSRLNDVKVVTVDSCQSSEENIVIISFVRSNSNNTVGFLNDYRRLNVALTRAKGHLVAVGSASTLLKSYSNSNSQHPYHDRRGSITNSTITSTGNSKASILSSFIKDVIDRGLLYDSRYIERAFL